MRKTSLLFLGDPIIVDERHSRFVADTVRLWLRECDPTCAECERAARECIPHWVARDLAKEARPHWTSWQQETAVAVAQRVLDRHFGGRDHGA